MVTCSLSGFILYRPRTTGQFVQGLPSPNPGSLAEAADPHRSASAAHHAAGERQAARPGGVEQRTIDRVEWADPVGLRRAKALLELRDAFVDAPIQVVDLVAGSLHLANGMPLQQV